MKKWKWNWGTGIALTLVLFVTLMGSMVYKATQQNFDLVSENYYLDELNFQEVINQKKNAAQLNGRMALNTKKDSVQITFPSDFDGKEKEVTIHLYCEQNAQKDIKLSPKLLQANSLNVLLQNPNSGRWLVKTTIKCEGLNYYFEPELFF